MVKDADDLVTTDDVGNNNNFNVFVFRYTCAVMGLQGSAVLALHLPRISLRKYGQAH